MSLPVRKNLHSRQTTHQVRVYGAEIDEEADPNQFMITADGNICQKGRNDVRITANNERIRRISPQSRYTTPITRQSPSRNQTQYHIETSDNDVWNDDEIALAVELSLSIEVNSQISPANSRPRSSIQRRKTSSTSVNETADPNLFCMGADGIIRPKVIREVESDSFAEESRRLGVTWLRVPSERQRYPSTPPPRPRGRNVLENSPSTVVIDHENLNSSSRRHAWIDPSLPKHPVPSKILSSQKPQYVAPGCILDSSKKAVKELLATSRGAASLPSTLAPTFNLNEMTYENLLLLDSAPLSAIERAKKGLTSQQLQNIHSIIIYFPTPQSSESNLPQCSICQEEFHHNDHGLCLPKCHHIFHGSCLGPWLCDHSFCPNCRQSIV